MMVKKTTSKSMDYPSTAMPDKAQERKWQAEDALRTLTRAEEIRSDRDLMGDVEKCRREKMRELAAIKVETAPKTIKGMK